MLPFKKIRVYEYGVSLKLVVTSKKKSTLRRKRDTTQIRKQYKLEKQVNLKSIPKIIHNNVMLYALKAMGVVTTTTLVTSFIPYDNGLQNLTQ